VLLLEEDALGTKHRPRRTVGDLLYEAAEDLPQLLGNSFRDAVKDLGA
jgi:hypothetical protein